MQETHYQTANLGVSPSHNECGSLSTRQRMQESLYQTADAGDFQTADAGDSLSDSGCRSLSFRQRMQDSLSVSGCRRLY